MTIEDFNIYRLFKEITGNKTYLEMVSKWFNKYDYPGADFDITYMNSLADPLTGIGDDREGLKIRLDATYLFIVFRK